MYTIKKILRISSIVALWTGIILICAGIWGMCFTYRSISQEAIVTPADASIPGRPVRGPLTLKSQADILREHALKMTGGKTYSQMARQIQKSDESGQPIFDAEGKPVMTANTARDIWVTVTSLTTALNLGILTYVFSGLVILLGFVSVWTSVVFMALSRREKTV